MVVSLIGIMKLPDRTPGAFNFALNGEITADVVDAAHWFGRGAGSWYLGNAEDSLYTHSAPYYSYNITRSLAADNDYVVVGSFNSDEVTTNSGRVDVYDATSLSKIVTFTPTDSIDNTSNGNGGRLGFTVAMNSTHYAVSEPAYQVGTSYLGKVRIYDKMTHSEVATIVNPGSVATQHFGLGLTMTDDYIAIGDPDHYLGYSNSYGTTRGRIQVYDATTFAYVRTIAPTASIVSNDGAWKYFSEVTIGKNLQISGNYLITSDPGAQYTTYSSLRGAMFVFDIIDGSFIGIKTTKTLAGSNSMVYGQDLTVYGDMALVTSYYDDPYANPTNQSTGQIFTEEFTTYPGTNTLQSSFYQFQGTRPRGTALNADFAGMNLIDATTFAPQYSSVVFRTSTPDTYQIIEDPLGASTNAHHGSAMVLTDDNTLYVSSPQVGKIYQYKLA